MVIKNVKIVQEDPAIIEVEFVPIADKFLKKVYNEPCFDQLSFDKLKIETGRLYYSNPTPSKAFNIVQDYFVSAFKQITLMFLELDPVRYPVLWKNTSASRDELFSNWYDNTNMKAYTNFMLCLDKAGFHQGIHLDNRFSMWAGIINLKENEFGTYHYTTAGNFGQDHYGTPHSFVASGKKMTGTFWLNTESTFHGVPHLSQDRRVAVCNQMLCSTWAQ